MFERSPLIQPAEMLKIMSLLKNSKRIVLFGHRGPDGDAIGSNLGWAEYLRKLGKNVTIVMPDMEPDFLRWMPNVQYIKHYCEEGERVEIRNAILTADLLCFLDFSQYKRLGDQQLIEILQHSKAKKMVIDHHLDPETENTDFIISRPKASSTCELVFRLVYQLGGYDAMTRSGACCLYCGMMTDTGAFAYNSNEPEIYMIVSLLLKKNIDKEKIYRNVFYSFSQNRLRFWGFLLCQRLRFLQGGKAAVIAYSAEDMATYKFKRGDAEGFVNEPLKVRGCRLSVSLREDTLQQNRIHVSLRSVDDIPCNVIAKDFFNGGGHLNASGGELNCSLEEAVKTAENAIIKYRDCL